MAKKINPALIVIAIIILVAGSKMGLFFSVFAPDGYIKYGDSGSGFTNGNSISVYSGYPGGRTSGTHREVSQITNPNPYVPGTYSCDGPEDFRARVLPTTYLSFSDFPVNAGDYQCRYCAGEIWAPQIQACMNNVEYRWSMGATNTYFSSDFWYFKSNIQICTGTCNGHGSSAISGNDYAVHLTASGGEDETGSGSLRMAQPINGKTVKAEVGYTLAARWNAGSAWSCSLVSNSNSASIGGFSVSAPAGNMPSLVGTILCEVVPSGPNSVDLYFGGVKTGTQDITGWGNVYLQFDASAHNDYGTGGDGSASLDISARYKYSDICTPPAGSGFVSQTFAGGQTVNVLDLSYPVYSLCSGYPALLSGSPQSQLVPLLLDGNTYSVPSGRTLEVFYISTGAPSCPTGQVYDQTLGACKSVSGASSITCIDDGCYSEPNACPVTFRDNVAGNAFNSLTLTQADRFVADVDAANGMEEFYFDSYAVDNECTANPNSFDKTAINGYKYKVETNVGPCYTVKMCSNIGVTENETIWQAVGGRGSTASSCNVVAKAITRLPVPQEPYSTNLQEVYTNVGCPGSIIPVPTATCSDGIQNQGESGIDCGGPCVASCPPSGGGGGGGGGYNPTTFAPGEGPGGDVLGGSVTQPGTIVTQFVPQTIQTTITVPVIPTDFIEKQTAVVARVAEQYNTLAVAYNKQSQVNKILILIVFVGALYQFFRVGGWKDQLKRRWFR